jgi:hypothetical protein
MPALVTSKPIGPKSSVAAVTMAVTASSSETSAWYVAQRPPAASIRRCDSPAAV